MGAIAGRGCALVTGGSRGIGAATARSLASEGWAVAVNYRSNVDAAEEVVEAIRRDGGNAQALCADVSDPTSGDELCERAERELGLPILVLVNNAGAIADRPLVFLDDESWQTVLETNLSASFRLMRRVLRPMMQMRFGRVINIASVISTHANPGQSCYAAAKAGLVGLTKTAAVEVARGGVTVNAIAPGLIETQGAEHVGESIRRLVPVGRAGKPEEVAACVRFLASEQAGYITGSVLTVDGGLSA